MSSKQNGHPHTDMCGFNPVALIIAFAASLTVSHLRSPF